MIKFDSNPASFSPPSLNFEHKYNGAILIFDDETWEEILKEDNCQKAQKIALDILKSL